jgi:hypothetical protein
MKPSHKNVNTIQMLFDQQLADLETIAFLEDKIKRLGHRTTREVRTQLGIIYRAYKNRSEMLKMLDKSMHVELDIFDMTISDLKAS